MDQKDQLTTDLILKRCMKKVPRNNYGKSYGSYDAVFLDPFSPLKSPELYSVEFFKTLKVLMKDDGMILTYTSAAPVRSALVEAGFHVGEGPSFGG